jgi:predicted nucleic acid-binding protein
MGAGYLIDTNVLIDAQTKKLPENGLLFLTEIINDNFTVSFVTYIEFLGYKDATLAMEEFIALANVIEVNKAIIDITITLRKTSTIQLPDAIIAATALVSDYTLITRNIIDFKNIPGLTIVNPWNI